MLRTISKCRACGSASITPVFDLGVQPLANDFVNPGDESSGYFPLKVMFCNECTLSQLSVVVNPESIYSNYPYVTSKSQTMLGHFKILRDAIKKECNPEEVVEIGSNDGGFLKFCLANGAKRVVGIDPAANLQPSPETGIMSICGLFDAQSASKCSDLLNPDVVVARHVFAHIDDWQNFMSDISVVAGNDALIVIEAPYVMDMFRGVEFDTIYHEHLSYVSIRSVARLLESSKFHLHKLLHFPIHGGAVVMMLRHNDSGIMADKSVREVLSRESVTQDSWDIFGIKARNKIEQLKLFVDENKKGGVCGFGASAKSTVWLNACGLNESHVDFICDCTPTKQGKISPGSGIPVVPESELVLRRPDYAILFAWNFKAEILKTNKAYLDAGGHFVIPDINLKVV